MSRAKYSIVTAAYNNPEQLKKFLDSAKTCIGRESGYEIVVVDDGSCPALKIVTDVIGGVRYIRLNKNEGPAKARNIGAKNAAGEYVIFFDSDVILRKDTLAKFRKHFEGGESAVAGEYDAEPIEKGFFPEFKSLIAESWIPKARYVSIFLLRAAGIRTDLFFKVGGFDENIKTASVEDYEFGDKLASVGIKIYYDPEILVRHHHPGFVKQTKLFYLRSRDWTALFIKRRGRFDNMCATPSEGLSSIAGTFCVITLAAAIIFHQRSLCALFLAALMVYAIANRRFISVVARRKGLLFIPAALIVKLPLAIAITFGFAAGVVRYFNKRLILKSAL